MYVYNKYLLIATTTKLDNDFSLISAHPYETEITHLALNHIERIFLSRAIVLGCSSLTH